MHTENLYPAREAGVVTERAIWRGVEWLLESGIQSVDGGCHAWFDPHKHYQMLYPEVTGYHLTLCEWAVDPSVDFPMAYRDRLLSAASRSAKWLSSVVLADGGAHCLIPPIGAVTAPGMDDPKRGGEGFAHKANRRYTFDAGIVLQGLVAFARRKLDGVALGAAEALGRWLCRNQRHDGMFVPFVGGESWQSVQADWSTRPGCHHAKIAIGLLALAELTGEEIYRTAALLAADAIIAQQQSDGRFVTNPVANTTNVHPHCYAAEAAWAVGTATDDSKLLDAAARATRWILNVSPPGQAVRTWRTASLRPLSVSNTRADGLAQVLRLTALTGEGSNHERHALAATLLTYQEDVDDMRRHGGFRFGRTSAGEELPHVNVWVTAFSVQALWLYSQVDRVMASNYSRILNWRYLV